VQLVSKATTFDSTAGLLTAYQYNVTAAGTKVNSISDTQMVIPRPLSPGAPAN
jgi:hypothetical protein